MRFIDYQQMLVAKQHLFLEWNRRLVRNLAIVEHADAALEWRLGMQSIALRIDHFALVHARFPDADIDIGKALCEEGAHVGPHTFRHP